MELHRRACRNCRSKPRIGGSLYCWVCAAATEMLASVANAVPHPEKCWCPDCHWRGDRAMKAYRKAPPPSNPPLQRA
jgi:hypothetical protein